MSHQSDQTEARFLACCHEDPSWIDRALQAGAGDGHFASHANREQWRLICELRLRGEVCDSTAVFAEAHKRGKLSDLGADFLERSRTDSTLAAPALLGALLDTYAKRESWRRLKVATESLKDGTADVGDIKRLADEVSELCSGQRSVQRSTADIADEAIRKAEEEVNGQEASRTLIHTGLSMFDRYADPIEAHELVVVGGRTSHGKSSFALQVAGHNLHHGLRVAIFSLETSDRAVLEQIVAQRAKINRRKLRFEAPDRQRAYLEKLRKARNAPNLMIFDRDLTVDAIAARCRLLANSFKPHLTIIDQLNLVQVPGGGSAYERISAASKAMIPICKSLRSTLMVLAQLNQESEKDERPPKRTDFRDSGQIIEDAHRVIAVHREAGQPIDLDHFDYRIIQLKNRDGSLCNTQARFHAPTTTFYEHPQP